MEKFKSPFRLDHRRLHGITFLLHKLIFGAGIFPTPFSFHLALHQFDALLLLFEIRVNVQIQRGAYIRVAEEDADGLVVAPALDAPRGEGMPQAVEAYRGDAQFFQEVVEVHPVRPRLRRGLAVGEHVPVAPDDFLQGLYERQQPSCHRHLADGVLRLRGVEHEFRVPVFPFPEVDPLYRPADPHEPLVRIEVGPPQGAHLSDAKARAEADEDAEVVEREVLPDMGRQQPLVREREHGYLPFLTFCGIDDVYLPGRPIKVLDGKAQDHLRHYHDIFHRLLPEAPCEPVVHQGLHVFLPYVRPLPQGREDMYAQQQAVGRVGGRLDELTLVLPPQEGDFFEFLFHNLINLLVKRRQSYGEICEGKGRRGRGD